MTKPVDHSKAARRKGPPSRYVSAASLALLRFSFPGRVPSVVIAQALEEKARREGRPLPPREGDGS
ncbi:hypothetical protein ABZT06_08620 [Streptomyces sp. NPDC005483]|uniref:hypothetical protein n=1 Tax=Streptomyces sp. NPDC005483 TaxID=3154882 RepID=UPI0033A0571E